MKTARIKVTSRKGKEEFFKTYDDVYDEARKKFEKELRNNPHLDGLLRYNISIVIDNWNSTQKYYNINL
jgi:hypothetical protein